MPPTKRAATKGKAVKPKKIAPKRISLSARLRAHAKQRKPVVKKALKAKVSPLTPKIHPELLRKHHGNPIIEPQPHLSWESKATFNPGAVELDGKVHVMYRAIGDNDISVLGHAVSYDGLNVHERSNTPAYIPKFINDTKEKTANVSPPAVAGVYLSGGGGWGGCEDPRLTLIEDRIYLTYTAFDGWGFVRVALASISTDDFLRQQWFWKKQVFLSPPGEVHKNWVLFPEKINGKYAILHSISPNILVDYVDDLDSFSEDNNSITSYYNRHSMTGEWDSWVRGMGPPPIKTKEGWLLLYHAMDVKDPNRYKLGAMIVDLQDPTKVLYRSKYPVLEPEEWYENTGWKSGVVYACGAVVKSGVLFVYYGGADAVVCVATADLDEFVEHLKRDGAATLTPGPKASPTKIVKP